MKVSIRIKFFVVLLAFSLGPIFISRGITMRAAQKMANEVSEKARIELLDIVSAELEYNAVSLLALLDAKGDAMMIGARMLAQRVEHFLEWQSPEAVSAPYFSNGFADTDSGPAGAEYAEGYVRETMGGKIRPIKISLEHPAYYLPPGVNRADVADQITRLQGLLPSFKEIYSELKDTAYWLHVGLESGVYATYPGHGNFPMMYDHRNQEWYKRTRQASGASVWTTPIVDPSTHMIVATVGHPVRDETGKFIGTASLDVPISVMLDEADLKSRWSGDIRSFMVQRASDDKSGDDGLLILAQQEHGEGGRRHWMSGIEQDWLVSGDSGGFKNLMQVITEKTSGVVHLSYRGKPSVWAFASNEYFSFMLIVPESVVSKLPDEVVGSLTGLFARMRDISSIISGVMLIITGLIAWFGSRAITRPILVMAEGARRLARGDFSARMPMRMGDERDILIDSFNEMGPQLKEHLRISKDLELAQEVQKLLLPRTEPRVSGYDVSGGIAYCDQTGGDYYDFIEVSSESGRICGVVLGDVSGHGVPSSLVMATARGQLHSLSKVIMAPEVRIGAINNFLSADLDGTGRFLTMFYLLLEEDSNRIRWVRAGHDPAVRYTPETDEFGELGGEGLALGVLPDFQFHGYEDTLESGEILVLATDGVWEARNSTSEMFGKKRMLAIIRENAHKSAESIQMAIMDGVSAYQGNGQEDDIAVVVIRKT
jgi:sigma-B regulation protein RsbU (phosphoserine phosphatase)